MRGATLRRHLISVSARIARHGHGHLDVHLPEHWRWHDVLGEGAVLARHLVDLEEHPVTESPQNIRGFPHLSAYTSKL